jgi:hypothetical protein
MRSLARSRQQAVLLSAGVCANQSAGTANPRLNLQDALHGRACLPVERTAVSVVRHAFDRKSVRSSAVFA